MTAEQLATIRALEATHPGPFTVYRDWETGDEYEVGPPYPTSLDSPTQRITFGGDNYPNQLPWLEGLCEQANAVPDLLAHIDDLMGFLQGASGERNRMFARNEALEGGIRALKAAWAISYPEDTEVISACMDLMAMLDDKGKKDGQ